MSPATFPLGQSRVVAGRYPPPGSDPHADAIRERRGERGITPLDANLLHVPPVAGGFNSLLGAVRTKGKLPGALREIMILRVAAINHASFEWIHHEIVARQEGLSTGQLYAIRDVDTPLPPHATILTPLHISALIFTDHSTRNTRIPMDIIQGFKNEIKSWVAKSEPTLSGEDVDKKVDDLYVEAAMVVASYNMVSRFLLATDVAGLSDMEVPWPVDKKEHFISLPSFPPAPSPTHAIHAVTIITDPSAPWLVFANSLLTDWTMWSYVVPYFLDLPSSGSSPGSDSASESASASNDTAASNTRTKAKTTTYNILLHSQRGHGRSTLPLPTEEGDTMHNRRRVTIPLLAHDIAHLLDALHIPQPVQSVVGVSQGGAAALAFGALYGHGTNSNAKTRSIVACDTAPRTPAGNKEAWEERIRLVYGSVDNTATRNSGATDYAERVGMRTLAKVTVPRWFPPGSLCHPDSGAGASSQAQGYAHADTHGHATRRTEWVERMIQRTNPVGFAEGARALSEYNLLDSDSDSDLSPGERLFESKIGRVLLVAGSLDGGGRVGEGLKSLCKSWTSEGGEGKDGAYVEYVEVGGAGHLPMIDAPEVFCEVLGQWLQGV
ncbi:hypothetical protein CVT25_012967 [Psilocybe cyanescens]|uniref:Carboxymuconolactone decarboxylase-like domain-containing protein n=1 Tax=Psilocybe cyanescens TaxID=93625 RepID=A0A409VTX1_PSICY|nr:hypothetical protein CVT25_012967 [Psilocybe cyanescens]